MVLLARRLEGVRQSAHRTTHFHVPRTRTLFGDRAFSTAAPRLWNNLSFIILLYLHIASYVVH